MATSVVVAIGLIRPWLDLSAQVPAAPAPIASADEPSSLSVGPPRPNVLVLNSGHRTNEYTYSQDLGIESALRQALGADVPPIVFEDLAIESEPSAEYAREVYDILNLRLRSRPINLIITTDTYALRFALGAGRELFPQVPVVFSAAKVSDAELSNADRPVTGVRERVDVAGTLKLIAQLHPNSGRIIAIADSYTGHAQELAKLASRDAAVLPSGMHIEFVTAPSTEELIAQLRAVERGTPVLYLAFSDASGSRMSRDRVSRVCMAANGPVYAVYDAYLGKGIVGGLMACGSEYGRAAGELAARVLEGEPADGIPIVENRGNSYWFDDAELRRWRIPHERLPVGYSLINTQHSFYQQNRYWIWPGSALLLVQSALIMILISNRARRRRAEAALLASRERLELAVQGSNLTIWDWDIVNDRTEYAGRFDQLLRRAPGESRASSAHWEASLHPDDHERVFKALRAHLDHNEPYDIEYRLYTVNGTYRWFRSRAEAIRDSSGRAVRMAGTLTDVTDRVEAQDRLAESEHRLQLAIHGSNLAVWDWEPSSGAIHWYGPLAARFGPVGHVPDGFERWKAALYPDDLDRVLAELNNHLDSGRPYDIEYRLRTPDGRYRWYHARGQAVRNEAGVPIRMTGSLTDVHDLVEARRQVRESEERFRIIFEQAAVGIAQVALDGRFTVVNDRLCAMLGRTREELLSTTYMAVTHPDDLVENLRLAQKAYDGGPSYTLEKRYLRPDGTVVWANLSVALARNADGSPACSISVVEDITQRRAAERALRASEERYRRIVETTQEGIWLVDTEWKTTFVNARMAEILGVAPEAMIGRHIFDFADEEGRRAAKDNMRRRESGISENHDFRFVRPDGSSVWTAMNTNPITDDSGRFIGALAMVTDITSRREVEQALLRERRMFLGGPAIAWQWSREPGWPVEYVSANVDQLGYTPEQFYSGTLRFADLIHPDDLPRVADEVQSHITNGRHSFEQEYRLRTADGRWVWLADHTVIERDADGEATHFGGYTLDITARRAGEQALRESKDNYRALLNGIPDVMFRVDRDGRYLDFHAPDGMPLLLPPEEFLGRTAREVLNPALAEQCMTAIERSLSTGEPGVFEYQTHRDNNRRDWEVRVVPISDSQALLLVRDVTDRRIAEQRIRDSEQRLSLLISQAPIGVIGWNSRFEVASWNPAAEQIFGFSAAEAMGRHGSFIVPDAARPIVDEVWRALIGRRGGIQSENENTTSTGETIVCEWHNTPLVGDDNQVIGVASFVQDVTERVRSERRQALMMAELDHRVKNNMAAVLSLAEQTGRSTGSFEEFQSAFMGRVRALARMHTALASSRWRGADLHAIIHQIVEPYSGHESGRLEVDGPSFSLPPRASQSLAMTLNELATNASKYGALSSPTGRVIIRWSVTPPATPAGEDDYPTLHLTWLERDGPTCVIPKRRGLGIELIEGAITYQLGGDVSFQFNPEGLSCTLSAPVIPEEATTPPQPPPLSSRS